MRLAMAVVVALVSLTGCALVFQERQPDRCTTSRRLPSVDLALLGVEAGAAIAGDVLRTDAHPTAGGVLIGIALAAVAVQAVSARAGFQWAEKCAVRQPAANAAK